MSLNIYTHDNDSSNMNTTDRYGSCAFTIGLSSNSFSVIKNLPKIQGNRITEIHGIADETIQFGYSTEWGDSPGAKMVSKMQTFTRSEAFKMFSGSVFNPNPGTDKWTQLYPKDGSVISVALKFRAYYKGNYLNTSSYMTIIPYLIYLTSPMTEFSLLNEFNNISGACKNAEKTGEELSQELNSIANKNGTFSEKAEGVLNTVEKAFNKLLTDSRGTATFTLSFGDLLTADDTVDWIITDWSFTPSVACGDNNNPLWIDFNVNMETNEKVSFDKLKRIFTLAQLG